MSTHPAPSALLEPHQPSHRAQQLGALVLQIEAFLQAQLQRLEQVLDAAAAGNGAARDAQAERDFLRRQRQWDAELREAAAQLRREQEQLAEAWRRLECGQRRLLQSARQGNEPSPTTGDPVSRRGAPQRDVLPAEPPAPCSERAPLPGRPAGQPVSADGGDAALLFIRQLKREIHKHTRSGGGGNH